MSNRKAVVSRDTTETQIQVSIDLDGSGKASFNTGVSFLEHMLDQIARHGLIDIDIKAKGDLHIDDHHTTEDTGWAIGAALDKALDERAGINRYANSYVPMDECLSRVVLDVSGRPFLIWQVDLPAEKLGTMETELFREWFQAFAMSAGLTLHVKNEYGENTHHIIESCFKALARALRQATEIDPRGDGRIPSTKGVLGKSL